MRSLSNIEVLFDQALDAVIGMDSQGRVTAWNRSAETLFGWSRAEVLSRPLARLIVPQQHREAHARGLSHYKATGEGRVLNTRIQITAVRRSGEEFPVELSIIPTAAGGVTVFYGFVRSLESSVAHERAIERKRLEASVLFEISRRVLNEESSDAFVEFCVQKICDVCGFSVGHVFFPDNREAPRSLISSGIWVAPHHLLEVLQRASDGIHFAQGEGLPGRVWAAGTPLSISDIHSDPCFVRAPGFAETGLNSAFAFPVMQGGRVLALMEFFGTEKAEVGEDVVVLATTIGNYVGLAYERKEASERREFLRRELAHRVGNSLAVLASIFRRCCTSADSVAELQESFEPRLLAVGHAHRALAAGDSSSTSLREIIAQALTLLPEESEMLIDGPALMVTETAVVPLSLTVHELTTNALKHGAFKGAEGSLSVTWRPSDDGRYLVLAWREALAHENPDTVIGGYGSALIQTMIETSLRGQVYRSLTGRTFTFEAWMPMSLFVV